jgi:hypothetical protein
MATIEGRPADRIPVHHIQFSVQAASAILGRDAYVGGAGLQWKKIRALSEGADSVAEFEERARTDAVAIARACGHDILRLRYWDWPNDESPIRRVDEQTFLFGDPDADWYTLTYDPALELLTRKSGHGPNGRGLSLPPDDPTLTREDLQRMAERAEDPDRAGRGALREQIEACRRACGAFPDDIIKLGSGTVMVPCDSPQHLMAAATWPDLYARYLLALAGNIAATIPRLVAAGMVVNFSGADFCAGRGPLISPALCRDVVAPALSVIVDACHAHGVPFLFGSDGDFRPVADIFFEEVGVDGWFELDRSAGMELRELRERYAGATLVGNIRVQLLHRGTVEDVVREVTDCMEVAHELGGVIVGASNMIMPGTPPRNVEALLTTIDDLRSGRG